MEHSAGATGPRVSDNYNLSLWSAQAMLALSLSCSFIPASHPQTAREKAEAGLAYSKVRRQRAKFPKPVLGRLLVVYNSITSTDSERKSGSRASALQSTPSARAVPEARSWSSLARSWRIRSTSFPYFSTRLGPTCLTASKALSVDTRPSMV